MTDLDKVTIWLMENPGSMIRVAEAVADIDPDYARQIAKAFTDMARFYGLSRPDCDDEPDCDDGDALASAGFGTDEDYGGDCDHI